MVSTVHFSYCGMIARSQLAILDNNSGIGVKQAQTKITETISNKYIQKLQKIGVSKKIMLEISWLY